MTLCTRTVENYFAMLFELVQLRVRIRERCRAGKNCVRQNFNAGRGEQRLLEGREVIEHSLRWLDRYLRMSEECPARLFLKRSKARIMLVATLPVGTIRIL